MSKEPFLVLDGLIIPNPWPLVKKFFDLFSFSFFKVNEIRLVTYPILDGLIILELGPNVKNFFELSFLVVMLVG